MHPVGAFIVVFGCLMVGGLGYPRLPTFPSCQSPVCHSGVNTGYGCYDGVCDFVCSKSLCRSAANNAFPQRGIQETWGSGALNIQGCYSGNCSYWGQDDATLVGGVQGHDLPAYPMVGDGQYHGHGYDPSTAYDMPYDDYALQSYLHTSVYTLDPNLLQSTLLQMPNVHQLIMAADPFLLQTALMHVPGWSSYASSMDAKALQSVVAGLPYIKEILASMDPTLLQYIVASVLNTDSMLFGVGSCSNQTTMPSVTSHKHDVTEPTTAMSEPPTETPDQPNSTDFNVTHFILSTVPSIPPQYANVLLSMDPGFVQFIIMHHDDLPGLLTSMNAQTLLYVAAHVPTFGTILSNLDPNTLKVVFAKLTNIDGFLKGKDLEVVQAMLAKLPSLGNHTHPKPVTTTLLGSSTLKPKLNNEVTADALAIAETIAPVFTNEELEIVRSKIPLFDKVLKWADPEKVVVLRKLLPDYPKIITDMRQETLKAINSNLRSATELILTVREMLLQGAYGKKG